MTDSNTSGIKWHLKKFHNEEFKKVFPPTVEKPTVPVSTSKSTLDKFCIQVSTIFFFF